MGLGLGLGIGIACGLKQNLRLKRIDICLMSKAYFEHQQDLFELHPDFAKIFTEYTDV